MYLHEMAFFSNGFVIAASALILLASFYFPSFYMGLRTLRTTSPIPLILGLVSAGMLVRTLFGIQNGLGIVLFYGFYGCVAAGGITLVMNLLVSAVAASVGGATPFGLTAYSIRVDVMISAIVSVLLNGILFGLLRQPLWTAGLHVTPLFVLVGAALYVLPTVLLTRWIWPDFYADRGEYALLALPFYTAFRMVFQSTPNGFNYSVIYAVSLLSFVRFGGLFLLLYAWPV
jgi:hypothetical protein